MIFVTKGIKTKNISKHKEQKDPKHVKFMPDLTILGKG
jgi:hypothetical protein